MSNKTWKDHLLSSGIPLEHSVEESLKRLDLLGVREYRYVRPNEQGVPTVFSVDIHATNVDPDRDAWLELLIECKYRHPGTNWVFCPESYESVFGPGFDEVFVRLDRLTRNREINTQVINSYASHYPLCERGIELMPSDSNQKTLRQAVEQLRYAVVDLAVDALSFQAGCRTREAEGDPISLIVPILVTTAELWRIREDSTIQSIRDASALSDVAVKHDLLVYREPPDNLARKHTTDAITERITERERAVCEKIVEESGFDDWDMFVESFARGCPSQFVVMTYDRFEQAMRNLNQFFARSDLIGPRAEHKESEPA